MAAIIKTSSDVLAAVIRSARNYIVGPPHPADEPKVDLAALERRLARQPWSVTRAEGSREGRSAQGN